MDKTGIIMVIRSRFKKLGKHYHRIPDEFNGDEIHDFRVEIKKLRAFFRLLNSELPQGASISMDNNIRAFYRATGNIRNLQVHIQKIMGLCEKHALQKPSLYLSLLHHEMQKEKNKASREMKDISMNHFREEVEEKIPSRLTARSIEKFISEKYAIIAGIISLNTQSDENLHEVRKNVKDLLYDWEYIGRYAPAILPAYFLEEKNREFLSGKVGDFHDLCLSVDFLQPLYVGQVNEEEKRELLFLKWEIENEKKKMKEEIVQELGRIKGVPVQ